MMHLFSLLKYFVIKQDANVVNKCSAYNSRKLFTTVIVMTGLP